MWRIWRIRIIKPGSRIFLSNLGLAWTWSKKTVREKTKIREQYKVFRDGPAISTPSRTGCVDIFHLSINQLACRRKQFIFSLDLIILHIHTQVTKRGQNSGYLSHQQNLLSTWIKIIYRLIILLQEPFPRNWFPCSSLVCGTDYVIHPPINLFQTHHTELVASYRIKAGGNLLL